jgi:endo-1,3-1,4-beta-glycanase ExoK
VHSNHFPQGRILYAVAALCSPVLTLLILLTFAVSPAAAKKPGPPTPPVVAVAGIDTGATLSGALLLDADATDNIAVTQVKWYVDYVEVAWDGEAPWRATWSSKAVADGTHTIFAKAADARGTWGTSAIVTFTVRNDTIVDPSPTVAVTSPVAGATVSSTVALSASGINLAGFTQMKWFVDGAEVGWDGAAPWTADWNSLLVANGEHAIFAKGLTAGGTWITSPPVLFEVNNARDGGSRWRLLVSDEFNEPALDLTKWLVYGPNWSGHAGNGIRDGRSVSMQDGTLTITAQMLDGKLVAGGVASRLDRVYGRYEFRVRTDADPSGATSGNVLTWPQTNNWPIEGENNIYETTTASRTPFSSFVHYGATNQQYWFHHHEDGTQWHTMAMEWEPDAIRVYRDGVHVWTVTDANAIPDVAHHVVMQLDAIKPTMTGVVRYQVDWMRIYERVE